MEICQTELKPENPAFMRSLNQSSQIFWYQNCCAFMRSCVESLRYGSVQIELRPKMSAFMRSCVQTSEIRALNFLVSKLLCVRGFMRSKFEVWISPNRNETKNVCVHAFRPVKFFWYQNCFGHIGRAY